MGIRPSDFTRGKSLEKLADANLKLADANLKLADANLKLADANLKLADALHTVTSAHQDTLEDNRRLKNEFENQRVFRIHYESESKRLLENTKFLENEKGHFECIFRTLGLSKRKLASIRRNLATPNFTESCKITAFLSANRPTVYELEKTNNTTIMRSFNDVCAFLWNGKIAYEKVWLIVTDQASYMLLAFSNLKTMYSNLKHVTCLAHSLHRVCEAIREEYQTANEFLTNMRKVLLKAPARIQIFKEVTQNSALPPDAVVTRWGTWILCAVYSCKNFNKIGDFLNALLDDSVVVTKAKKLIQSNVLKDELFNVSMYAFLPEASEKLEQQGLSKEDQWKIFTEASQCLDGFAGEKYTSSLNRNPDVESFATEKNPEIRLKSLYAPLVSVDVERSFSQYKLILSNRRQNLMLENIEYLNIVTFNKFLFE